MCDTNESLKIKILIEMKKKNIQFIRRYLLFLKHEKAREEKNNV